MTSTATIGCIQRHGAPNFIPDGRTAQPCGSDALKSVLPRKCAIARALRVVGTPSSCLRCRLSRRIVRLECLSENRMAPRGRCERALSQFGRAEAQPERPASRVPAVLRRDPVRGDMVKCDERISALSC
jgi:hypothetical protein